MPAGQEFDKNCKVCEKSGLVPKQKRFTADEVSKRLSTHGFEMVNQKGSHQKWKNFITGCQVIVPYHKGKQLPIGTLKSIIEGSGLSSEVWQ